MLNFKNKKLFSRRDPSPGRSPVFSYYNNRPADILPPKPHRQLFRKATASTSVTHHVHHIPTYIAVATIIGALIYATILSTQPRIILGRNNPNNSLVRSQAIYQQSIAQILSSSIFNRSKLTVNTNKIENQIQLKFPEIQNATLSLPLIGRRPVIGLDPAIPTLILDTRDGSYIIGEDGRTLIKIGDLATSVRPNLPVLQDDSGLSIEQGKASLTKDNVDFITTVIKQLFAKNITTKSLQLPAIANEFHVSINNQPYFVKFNLSGDATQQVGTYLAVKEQLEGQHITPSEYIDVRVDERAFYK